VQMQLGLGEPADEFFDAQHRYSLLGRGERSAILRA
jgi:hypothetical protein